MERQLREMRKKMDESQSEMRRYMSRWKTAGEDSDRVGGGGGGGLVV